MAQQLLPPPYDEIQPPSYDIAMEEKKIVLKRKILAYSCLVVCGGIVNIIIWSIYFGKNG